MMVLFVVAAVVYALVLRLPHHRFVGPTLAAMGVHPVFGIVTAATLVGFVRMRRIRSLHGLTARKRADEILAIDLVASGVEAGVSFPIAAVTASQGLNRSVAADLLGQLRRSDRGVLVETRMDPTPIDVMFRIARASAWSGANLGSELRALSDAERARDDARHEERLARLPVKMLFPLAFLILPGFLLVAVVPAMVGGISKLTL